MLPFEVDVALESEINAYKDREAQDEADEWTKQLYPVSQIDSCCPMDGKDSRSLEIKPKKNVAGSDYPSRPRDYIHNPYQLPTSDDCSKSAASTAPR